MSRKAYARVVEEQQAQRLGEAFYHHHLKHTQSVSNRHGLCMGYPS